MVRCVPECETLIEKHEAAHLRVVEAAQKFVSVNDEELGDFDLSVDIGTWAMRKAQALSVLRQAIAALEGART